MRNKRFLRVIINNRIFLVLIFIILIVAVLDPVFLDIRNILNLLNHISINGIMALGITILMTSKSFDLSIGSILSLSGLIAVLLQPHLGVVLSTILGILSGGIIGLINGVVVAYGKVNAFIATLGTLVLIRGVALIVCNNEPVSGKILSFTKIGQGAIGPIPLPIIYFVSLAIILWVVMKWTDFGRNAYAIGGNELAATLSGVKVNTYKVLYFVLSGFCASFAGVVLSSRINTGSPILGESTLFIVMTAVVLGGTGLSGGIGSIKGTVLGVLIIGVIGNGMDLLDVSSYYQEIIRGLILVLVILFDAYNERRKAIELGR